MFQPGHQPSDDFFYQLLQSTFLSSEQTGSYFDCLVWKSKHNILLEE